MLTINYDSINDIWVLTYLFVICLKGIKVIRRFFFLNNYLHNDDKKKLQLGIIIHIFKDYVILDRRMYLIVRIAEESTAAISLSFVGIYLTNAE